MYGTQPITSPKQFMKRQIFYFLLFFVTTSFSQTVDKKAKFVNDFILCGDTLIFFCTQPTLDSTTYFKFQVFKADVGIVAREFITIKIKKSNVSPENIHFKELCTSNLSVLDFKN